MFTAGKWKRFFLALYNPVIRHLVVLQGGSLSEVPLYMFCPTYNLLIKDNLSIKDKCFNFVLVPNCPFVIQRFHCITTFAVKVTPKLLHELLHTHALACCIILSVAYEER